MICNRDMMFNERMKYKDMHTTRANNSEQSGLVYVDADDVPNSSTTKHIIESP